MKTEVLNVGQVQITFSVLTIKCKQCSYDCTFPKEYLDPGFYLIALN